MSAPTATARLSAVIETVNVPPGDYDELDATLAALADQTMPRDEIEVICVVDPLVHPGLGERLRAARPPVTVVDAPGRWYYEQKNLGARAASSDIVAFIDSDNLPVPTWAASIERAFANGGARLGVVQGVIRGEPTGLGTAFEVTIFPHVQTDRDRTVSSIGASNVALRRADVLARPWDEAPMKHGPDVARAATETRAGREILLCAGAATRHAFIASLPLFLQRGVYWGYCFVALRRDAATGARWARALRRAGPLAPFLLAPAKIALDLARLARTARGRGIRVAAVAAGVLILNGAAVGIGAMKAVLGRPIPPSPY